MNRSIDGASARDGRADARYIFFVTAVLCVAALVLRASFGGLWYRPILDDSIQYINYPSSSDYGALIEQEGLFASRPLAAVMDLFVVGPLRGWLFLPVLLLAILHGLSAALFTRLFRTFFQTGTAFAVVYALLPLGCEGTYWLSASSRIVTGLFFTAAAAAMLTVFIEQGGWWRVGAHFALVLLSYSFYEQILVLSFALTGLIFLRSVRRTRRAWAALTAFAALAAYFAFTHAHSGSGSLGGRVALVDEFGPWYRTVFVPELLGQIASAFLTGGWRTAGIGFLRGLRMAVTSFGGWIFLILTAALAVGYVYLLRPHKNRSTVISLGEWKGALVWGALLALAPLAPYFVVANPWFSLRATVPSFVGLALIADVGLRALCRRVRPYTVTAAVLIVFFLIGGASEVADYKETARADDAMAAEILAHAGVMEGRVGILGLEEFEGGQNYAFHEHVASAGASEWALYGKLVAAGGGELGFSPVPLPTKDSFFYHGWNTDSRRLDGFNQLWLWEGGTLTRLRAEQSGMHDFALYRPGENEPCMIVWEETEPDGSVYGYLRRPE